eukprot:SAG22_NODE_5766_length_956_cov_1.323221_1_plen_42_part_10
MQRWHCCGAPGGGQPNEEWRESYGFRRVESDTCTTKAYMYDI